LIVSGESFSATVSGAAENGWIGGNDGKTLKNKALSCRLRNDQSLSNGMAFKFMALLNDDHYQRQKPKEVKRMLERLQNRKESKGVINGKQVTAFYMRHGDNQGYMTEGIFPYQYQYGKQIFATESAVRLAIMADREKQNN